MHLVGRGLLALALAPPRGLPRMCDPEVEGYGYYEAKRAALQAESQRRLAQLQEMEARDALMLRRLLSTRDGGEEAGAVEAEAAGDSSSGTIDALRAALADADAQRQLDAEALAGARMEREVDVQKTSAHWLAKLDAARSEVAALRTQLHQAELNLQRTAAFWIERLDAARAQAAEAEGLAAAAAAAAEASDLQREIDVQKTAAFWIEERSATASAARRSAELAAGLEAELAGFESDYEALSDRSEVKIDLSSEALHVLEAERDSALLEGEIAVQATAAFWIDKLRSAQEGAATAGAPGETAVTASAEASALARVAELEAALAEQRLVAERQLQATSAFWIDRISAEATGATAAAAAAKTKKKKKERVKKAEAEGSAASAGIAELEAASAVRIDRLRRAEEAPPGPGS